MPVNPCWADSPFLHATRTVLFKDTQSLQSVSHLLKSPTITAKLVIAGLNDHLFSLSLNNRWLVLNPHTTALTQPRRSSIRWKTR